MSEAISTSFCAEPGCTRLSTQTRCTEHRRPERKRPNDNFYSGRPWRRVRKLKLTLYAHCELQIKCHGKPATEVHHRKKRTEHPELQYDMDNLQSACKACHDTVTGQGK